MFSITIGHGKIEGINSINTNSLNNPYCIQMSKNKDSICSKCYSNRSLKFRTFLKQSLEKNDICLSETKLKLSEIPIINALYFRFNSFGELINKIHYYNLIQICKKNPLTTFSLWSKRKDLILVYKQPKNLILIYSELLINSLNKEIPEGFDKMFSVFTKSFAKENKIRINCKNSCINCLKCYTFNEIKYIKELVK